MYFLPPGRILFFLLPNAFFTLPPLFQLFCPYPLTIVLRAFGIRRNRVSYLEDPRTPSLVLLLILLTCLPYWVTRFCWVSFEAFAFFRQSVFLSASRFWSLSTRIDSPPYPLGRSIIDFPHHYIDFPDSSPPWVYRPVLDLIGLTNSMRCPSPPISFNTRTLTKPRLTPSVWSAFVRRTYISFFFLRTLFPQAIFFYSPSFLPFLTFYCA